MSHVVVVGVGGRPQTALVKGQVEEEKGGIKVSDTISGGLLTGYKMLSSRVVNSDSCYQISMMPFVLVADRCFLHN